MSRQRVYAIGVQYHRDGQVAQQGTRQPLCVRMPAQSGADHRHIAGGRLFQYCSILLRQRKSHSFFTFYGYDRIDFPGDPHIDQPRASPQRAPGGQSRGAGVALAAPQDEYPSKIPLVAISGTAGEDPVHIVRV